MNTPTPWRIDPLAPWLIIDEPGDSVCQTQQRVSLAVDQNQTERKANAALICRAVNSHEALLAALEKIVEIGVLAEPPGYESFTDEQKQKYPKIYSEEAHVALAALKLAKGEA